MFNKHIYDRLLSTRELGRDLVLLEEVGSTNDWIAQNLGGPGAARLVAVAHRQTAGRGRRGREWVSPPDENLAFSVACRIPAALGAPSPITLVAGVALAEAIADATDAEARLKYPNDVIIGGKKAAGILAELKKTDEAAWAVIGAGVNVNTRAESFPAELRETATSITIETGEPAASEAILAMFLNRLEAWLDGAAKDGVTGAVKRFGELSIPFIGREVTITGAGGERSGVARGIDHDGGLMVEVDAGMVEKFFSGEVTFHQGRESRV